MTIQALCLGLGALLLFQSEVKVNKTREYWPIHRANRVIVSFAAKPEYIVRYLSK